ncbi:MAG: 4-alpha-glucanotransferase [Acidimicrobiaceae bacterium]|nr:4-alpha-glucanotransferase [Acidimicrobiaceae bacterium]
MSGSSYRAGLLRSARRLGISAQYTDAAGLRRAVGDETLAALVALLDKETTSRPLAPVVVAWDGVLPPISPRPGRHPGSRGSGTAVRRLELRGEDRAVLGVLTAGPGEGTFSSAEILPYGVHDLLADGDRVAAVICAPSRADVGRPGEQVHPWGLFAPMYALRDERDLPAGDITCLEELGIVAGRLGASVVATLPLLAEHATAEGGTPGQHPYSPLSRMFWNEGYLDLMRLPELAGDFSTVDLLGAAASAASQRRSPPGDLVDVADIASIASKARPALDEAVRRMQLRGGERLRSFEAYATAHPELGPYSRYRAAAEIAGADRQRWPTAWRAGRIGAGEVPAAVAERHSYAQWAMDSQLAETSESLAGAGVGLAMDLPIGCSSTGYDPWAFRDVYVEGASIGAPPDSFFTAGQNWGFPPPHPDADAIDGYPVLRACLTHSLRHAAVLRVDHVLGWSRLWWIPDGMAADHGAYVRYPFDHLLAVANLEAWRYSARLVGEDLGTVQRGLRAKLRKHGVAGMQVAVFELDASPKRRLRPPAGTVAYVDTHDTATFAGWFDGTDVELRSSLGLLAAADAEAESERRRDSRRALIDRLSRAGALPARTEDPGAGEPAVDDPDALEVLGALLAELGASDADLVLVALEDLWAEHDPQNVPGTTDEHANFSRRQPSRVEQLLEDGRARAILGLLDTARRSHPRRPR